MSEEVYSTQIDDLPDDVSDISYNTKNIDIIRERYTDNSQKNKLDYNKLFIDWIVLFFLVMIGTNKSFLKLLASNSFIASKGMMFLTIILSILISSLFVLYQVVF